MTTHTTKRGKAKCLHYRNGRRCGRVATKLVRYQNNVTPHLGASTIPMCDECARVGEVVDESSVGFNVHTTGLGMQSRHYRRI